jgi:2-polyprenyl-3-methyl-5-hydroxy-6-metoxy-1,4-benzoquinol methylase
MKRRGSLGIRLESFKNKVNYFFLCFWKIICRQKSSCPSCGHAASEYLSRKYFVTSLRQCTNCKLMFKVPGMTSEENYNYYQVQYQEGFTQEMPSIESLEDLKLNFFENSTKGYKGYLQTIRELGLLPGSRIFDFGCSWGYGSWFFLQKGFSLNAFEISTPRAQYARKHLGIDVVPDPYDNKLSESFDLFFSSHVLEHVPCVKEVIDIGFKLLRTGGFFIAFTPNGSLAYRNCNKRAWKSTWGMKHPNYLNEQFYKNVFKNIPYYIESSPYEHDKIRRWVETPVQYIGNLQGEELMIIVQKH